MKTRFFIYGITGWVMEIIWTGLGSFLQGRWELSGFTYLWMFPIYGLAVLLEPVHDTIRPAPWWVRGMIWASFIIVLEYVAGSAIKAIIGFCPWDYSRHTKYSIGGFIRLDYAPVWFAVGLLFEKFHDLLNRFDITSIVAKK